MSGINDNEFANIDGDLVNYDIQYGEGKVSPNSQEGFMSSANGDDYYDADGDYNDADGNDDFYNARGLFKRKNKRQKRGGGLRGLIGSGKVAGALSKAQGVLGALSNKNTQTQPEPYVPTPEPTPTKTPLSKGAKIGIAVGVVVVLGVVGFIVYKKMSKGK
jgi:hypothetical protein